MWHGADNVTKADLTFTFGSPVTLTHLLIWNHNQEKLIDRGVKEMEVFYAETADGEWKSAGVFTLQKATDNPRQTATDLLSLNSITAAKIKLDLKKNHGSNTHIGLSQVFFLQCEAGMEQIITAISRFELLSKYDYPAAAYQRAEGLYQQCIAAMEQNASNPNVLAASLIEALEDLNSQKSEKRLSGTDTLTMKLNVGDSLPETVTVLIDGVPTEVEVVWLPIPDGALNASGTITVQGRIAGTPLPACVAVSVKGKSSTALEALIGAYEALDLSAYTSDSAASFTAALAKAKAVLDDVDARQDEIDRAKSELKSAKYALVEPAFATLSLKVDPPVNGSDPDDSKPGNPTEQDPPASTSPDSGNDPADSAVGNIITAAAIAVAAAVVIGAVVIWKKKK